MKTLFLPLLTVTALLMASVCQGEQILPFKELRITLRLGDGRDHMQPGEKKSFGAVMEVTSATRDGKISCISKFMHSGLPDTKRLSERDIRALFEVSEAASQQKALRMNIVNPWAGFRKDEEGRRRKHVVTTYRSALKRGNKEDWVVTISQNRTTHEVSEAELKKLKELLKQTEAAEAWYHELLSTGRVPKPTPDARPPAGSIVSFHGLVDKASFDELAYVARLQMFSDGNTGLVHNIHLAPNREDPDHKVTNRIRPFPNDYFFETRLLCQGDWVRGMMTNVKHAATKARARDAHSFIGHEELARYEVTADPDSRTAKLRIHPAFGASDLSHYDASFNLDEARRISAMIRKADEAEEWFEKNQGVFVTKPWQRLPQAPVQ